MRFSIAIVRSSLVLNVTTLVRGFHPSEFKTPADDPYHFARQHGLRVESLDDYLDVLDRLFRAAKEKGAVCLKTTLAYQRTLQAVLGAQREALLRMRTDGELSNEVMNRVIRRSGPSTPRNALRTGVDTPGPSMTPTGWPVSTGWPHAVSWRNKGRNTPTEGATITRSRTNKPSPCTSDSSIPIAPP